MVRNNSSGHFDKTSKELFGILFGRQFLFLQLKLIFQYYHIEMNISVVSFRIFFVKIADFKSINE